MVRDDGVAFHPAAVAVIECHLEELHPLPAGSVATLAILSVDDILIPSSMSEESPELEEIGPLLAQFGLCRMVAGPSAGDWSFLIGQP